MRQREYRVGPGAVLLLLIIVMVSMSVLGLLAMVSARNDHKLTERTCAFVTANHELSAAAERTLSELDAYLAECETDAANDGEYIGRIAEGLPDGFEMSGRRISWAESGERTLLCEIELLPLGEGPRTVWTKQTFTVLEDEGYGFSEFDVIVE